MSSEVTMAPVLSLVPDSCHCECCSAYIRRGFTYLEALIICNRIRGTEMVKTLDQHLEEMEDLAIKVKQELDRPKEDRDDHLILEMLIRFHRLKEYIDNLR